MATFSITTPQNQDSRIVAAFGKILNLKDANGDTRSATGAEIKQAVLNWLIQSVREREQFDARTTAESQVTDITPS